jgi:type II restriction/modification system DNA methylase subunit YeeA
MNKSAIIEFSNRVREKLNAEVRSQAAYYGILPEEIRAVEEHPDSVVINGSVFNSKIKNQRSQLVKQIKEKGYEQVMEEATYTWFNRLVALKFMEMNGCLPDQIKVFTSADPDKTEPDLLTNALKLDFLDLDRDKVFDLKAENKNEELYKCLILKLCNYLHDTMPFLFEKIEDYTELLFPDKLLHTGSVLHDLNSIIPKEDWHEVEIIGWIYQDYIAPKKDRVFADLKKNIKISKENIPAVTQLFTPNWIVRYLVENSLGRLWMLNRPDSTIADHMEYYIKPDPQAQPETDFLKINSPEELKICDPACGSGHMLVYAFDLLYTIYEEEGYLSSEIPELILTKNLFGIEIDRRAGELAGFALTMKARAKDRQFFKKQAHPNICMLENISFEERELNAYIDAVGNDLFTSAQIDTLLQFAEADNFGSLIRPAAKDVSNLLHLLDSKNLSGNLSQFSTHQNVLKALKQADYLSPKYHVVIANPPYMGGKGMNTELKAFAQENYPDSKSDLFAMFIERNRDLALQKGMVSMITMQSWMFLPSFEELRKNILNNNTILSMAHFGAKAFDSIGGEVVSTTAFIIENEYFPDHKGVYLRLIDGNCEADKEAELKEKRSEPFKASSTDFMKIPGNSIAYWISDKVKNIISENPSLEEFAEPKPGLQTSDNDRFLRLWFEVSHKKIGIGLTREKALTSSYKWFPHNKGGKKPRKWYGNNEFVINFEKDGAELKHWLVNNPNDPSTKHWSRNLRNYSYYFLSGVTWSAMTSTQLTSRMNGVGFLFDTSGPTLFAEDLEYFCGFINSNVFSFFTDIFSQTLSKGSDSFSKVPIILSINKDVQKIAHSSIMMAREEWDTNETSWDFKTNELLHHKTTGRIEEAYNKYCAYWKEKFFKLHANEEELNRIFIDIYDVADELTPEVSLEEITILKEETMIKGGKLTFRKDVIVKQFVSYAVGCMFGRYSIDKEGLVLANQGEKLTDFKEKVPGATFLPDEDNIIPILDDEYYTDDIVGRFKEFLKLTFGAETLSENLDFIAGALSKKGEASEKIIRDYFLKDFYKDHVRMYKKRPIYWLFTSGKEKVFNALVYMHRYDKTTLAKMRIDYLLDFESKLDAQRSLLEKEITENPENRRKAESELAKLNKKIEELVKYDELLQHKADQMIEIDLDDGVKVNYEKFEGLVGKI